MLKNPVNTNAQRQPKCSAIHGIVSGATIDPMFDPELKIPVASDLSFFGNHSATAFSAAGKFPDSPKPRKNRTTPNPSAVLTSAWLSAATLQIPIDSA